MELENPAGPYGSRKRLRPLIESMLNSNDFSCYGLKWMDERKKIFRFPWKIRKKSLEGECDHIVLKYIASKMWRNNTDPSYWKSTLRNDMNNVNDFQLLHEFKEENYKVYQLVDESMPPKRSKSQPKKSRIHCNEKEKGARQFSSQYQSDGSFRSRSPIHEATEPQFEDTPDLSVLGDTSINTFQDYFDADDFIDSCAPNLENPKDAYSTNSVAFDKENRNIPTFLMEFQNDQPPSTCSFPTGTMAMNTEPMAEEHFRNVSFLESVETRSHSFSTPLGILYGDGSITSSHFTTETQASSQFSFQQSTVLCESQACQNARQENNMFVNNLTTQNTENDSDRAVESFSDAEECNETLQTSGEDIPAMLPGSLNRPLMRLEIFYHNVPVFSDTIYEPTFTLYQGPSAFSVGTDLGKRIKLPDVYSPALQSKIQPDVYERIKKMWSKVSLGLSISLEGEDIYAIRRCKSVVVSKIINNGNAYNRLKRWEKTKIFNFRSKFVPLLSRYYGHDCHDEEILQIPSARCRFTFGVNHPPLDDKHSFIDVYVEHMDASQKLSECLQDSLMSTPSAYSGTNSFDKIIEHLQSVHM